MGELNLFEYTHTIKPENALIDNLKNSGATLTPAVLGGVTSDLTEAQIKHNQLTQYQGLPLSAKVRLTQKRIREWYEAHDGLVYIAFSGGKDSTVMAHIIKDMYPDVPMVFADTGNELDSIKEFVATFGDEVIVVKPKMSFEEVVEKYGYPVISKRVSRYINDLRRPYGVNEKTKNLRLTGITSKGYSAPSQKLANKWLHVVEAPFKVTNKCCGTLKISPTAPYMKETRRLPFVGTMASESKDRKNSYVEHGGCNAFDQKEPVSRPLMFWSDQDVLGYIKEFKVPYASCYGDIITVDGRLTTSGEKRTGCKFCLFGIHFEKGENRIQRLARVEPESYRHCIEDLGYDKVMDFLKLDWKPYIKNNP